MAENRLLAILMKPNELQPLSGDIDEKKWGYRKWRGWGKKRPETP
jgi:hypothetical protein